MEATIKTYIEQLIDLQLVKPGDQVLLDDPNKFPDIRNPDRPGAGWVVVVDTSVVDGRCIHIMHPTRGTNFGVFAIRVIDWKPAEGRTKEEGNEDREVR